MLHDPKPGFAPDMDLAGLNTRFEGAPAQDVLRAAIDLYDGSIAMVSSFGAESAVLLHMVSELDADMPVLLLETGMLFAETLVYQKDLSARLGLRDVRLIRPQVSDLETRDRFGALHISDPDACCQLRKVAPLAQALTGFSAQISGRKRFQNGRRAKMPLFEADTQDRVKVNPLADWTPTRIGAYFAAHDLPRHPLVEQGFLSIGCRPCTSKVGVDEDPRAGRWRGQSKDECGIHIDPPRQTTRSMA